MSASHPKLFLLLTRTMAATVSLEINAFKLTHLASNVCVHFPVSHHFILIYLYQCLNLAKNILWFLHSHKLCLIFFVFAIVQTSKTYLSGAHVQFGHAHGGVIFSALCSDYRHGRIQMNSMQHSILVVHSRISILPRSTTQNKLHLIHGKKILYWKWLVLWWLPLHANRLFCFIICKILFDKVATFLIPGGGIKRYLNPGKWVEIYIQTSWFGCIYLRGGGLWAFFHLQGGWGFFHVIEFFFQISHQVLNGSSLKWLISVLTFVTLVSLKM